MQTIPSHCPLGELGPGLLILIFSRSVVCMYVDQFKCEKRVIIVRRHITLLLINLLSPYLIHHTSSTPSSCLSRSIQAGLEDLFFGRYSALCSPSSHSHDAIRRIRNQSQARSIKPWLKAHLNPSTGDDGPSIDVPCPRWQAKVPCPWAW